MQPSDTAVYRFAEFELQPCERRLMRNGTVVALTPKVLDLLELLVSRAGHIVSKDELLSGLWPNRFVTEANLTKHVWTLRRALGQSDEGEGFIETVSKVGYRFTVPVRKLDAPTPVPPAAEPVVRHLQPYWVAAAVSVAFAVIALGAWWLWNGRQASFPWSSAPPGTVVAIVDFDNLSHSPNATWVGPAFVEMLGTEIALDGHLHLVPGQLVRDTEGKLPPTLTSGFAPDDLSEIRRRLAADIIVTGSYWAPPVPGVPLKLDITVQDARTGATLATLSRSAPLASLPDMIAAMGADLRRAVRAPAASESDMRLAANAQPPTVDVMRRMGNALDALHHYDPARARDELLQAIAQAPGYAPAYAYLSKAWAALGYHDKALAAAGQALAHAGDLPRPMQLAIAAQDDEVNYKWPDAVKTLRTLADLQKDDPEVALELIAALVRAGNPKDAQRTLDDLIAHDHALKDDARLELAAAQIAAQQDDTANHRLHAERALALATARDQAGLMADAELSIGTALTSSDHKGAETALNRAIVLYRAVSNPRGEADVHRDLGNLLSDTDPARAQAEYQRSLAQFQALGDQNGIAAAYSNLGSMLWAAGDRDGAEVAVHNVLSIRRATGDRAGQAWALAALAVEQSDERASEDAIAGFREAALIDADIGAHAHRGFTLYSLSDVLRLRGALTEAVGVCKQAEDEYALVRDVGAEALAGFECAQIALDRGDLKAAREGLVAARVAAVARSDSMTIGNVDLTMAQIDMGQANYASASHLLAAARDSYARADLTTGRAVALGFLAQCEGTLGDTAGRDRDQKTAAALRSQITEREEMYPLDVVLASLGSDTQAAVTALAALAADARTRQWPGLALEAELAEIGVLRRSGKDATALTASITKDAHALGYGWVLERLARS